MTWSLRVTNGDLVLNGTTLSTVTGHDKLIQDFTHFLLERMGTDNMHPEYGSLIDGGVQPDGTQVPSPIGDIQSAGAILNIEAEIRRIAKTYQGYQLARAQSDRLTYSKTTLTADEILVSVESVDVVPNLDSYNITITIKTGKNNTAVISTKVSA